MIKVTPTIDRVLYSYYFAVTFSSLCFLSFIRLKYYKRRIVI